MTCSGRGGRLAQQRAMEKLTQWMEELEDLELGL